MKFLVNMPLSRSLAEWLVSRGHDAVHADQIGLATAPDSAILKTALREDRVIVTADLDYPRLLALGRLKSPGLILFRRGDFSEPESLSVLERAFGDVAVESLPRSVVIIERDRVRVRSLPISGV